MSNTSEKMLTPREIYRWLSSCTTDESDKAASLLKVTKTTQIRFWRDILMDIMDEDAITMLSSTKDKRSRSLSNIMNRTGTSGVLSPIYKAFSKNFNSTKFLHLATSWIDMFTRYATDWFQLMEAISSFEDTCMSSDRAITPAIRTHLLALREEADAVSAANYQRQGFYCGVQLAWLTVYAFLGDNMDSRKTMSLRSSDGFSTSQLYAQYQRAASSSMEPVILTTRECEVCKQALLDEQYVESPPHALEQLRRLLTVRGKVLISAPAGMGKTELVRQLLVRGRNHGRYSRIAFVQYQDNLAASFRNAFRGLRNMAADEVMTAAEKILNKTYSGKTLLILDNARLDDPLQWARVARLACDVLVTSRQREADGFAVLSLPPMGTAETKRLLEINCGFPLTEPDEAIRALHQRVNGHPLAISLLGKIIKTRFRTVSALNQEIDENGYRNLTLIHYEKDESYLCKLRSALNVDALDAQTKKLLILFSMLDFTYWDVKQISALFQDVAADEERLSEQLYRAYLNGWLELRQTGYAMQPVTAEVMRAEFGGAEEYPMLCKYLAEVFAEREENTALPADELHAAEQMAAFLEGNCEGTMAKIISGAQE